MFKAEEVEAMSKSGWLRMAAGALLLAGMTAAPAWATDKNVIQLQVQVQQLEDSLARMQQANDERWALTKAGMDQDTASMQRIATTLATIQAQLAAQQDSSRNEQLSTQMQSLNDSVDEVKARLGRLEKQLNDMSATQQNIQNAPQSNGPGAQMQPRGGGQGDNGGGADAAAAAAAPPAKDLLSRLFRFRSHTPTLARSFTITPRRTASSSTAARWSTMRDTRLPISNIPDFPRTMCSRWFTASTTNIISGQRRHGG
jgi:chaperonin cofactor prefoldin